MPLEVQRSPTPFEVVCVPALRGRRTPNLGIVPVAREQLERVWRACVGEWLAEEPFVHGTMIGLHRVRGSFGGAPSFASLDGGIIPRNILGYL